VKAELTTDGVEIRVTVQEYQMIRNGLRELIGSMPEQDFYPRVGQSLESVIDLVIMLGDEAARLGVPD